MRRFYFLVWLTWAVRVVISSIALATTFALLLTLFFYINQGMAELTSEVFEALKNIFLFWFPLTWSFGLFIVLFRSLKYIFNSCRAGYKIKLLECNTNETIEEIGYGDIVRVWRKWFMLLIWLVVVQVIFVVFFAYVFSFEGGLFAWFSIYFVQLFIILGGYFSFILLGGRCKQVKIIKC